MVSLSSRTAYVLLGEIEAAFRAVLEAAIGDLRPDEAFSPEGVAQLTARRTREGYTSSPSDAAQLLPYLDFQAGFESLLRHRRSLPSGLGDGLASLRERAERVTPIRNRVAHNRPLETGDLAEVIELSERLSELPGFDWGALERAVRALDGRHGLLYESEVHLVTDPAPVVANNLPAPDYDETSLLGRRRERDNVRRAILGAWPVVSILGDGGIGKTALALQVCYDLVDMPSCPFEAIVWVSAKNSLLSTTEILRIEDAVSDSLGLFASATSVVGGSGDSQTAVQELLEVLSAFPILLVLDNVETVLDENFALLLEDIPLGSKVLITSRIGVKTERPCRLSGLSPDDSVRLMRMLDKSRGLGLSERVPNEDLERWADQMRHHPAHIKWFISGMQSGRSPEQLLSDDGLLLEFCMSNVYMYLGADPRSVLNAMVVIPGAHTMSDLAYLTSLGPRAIQQAILDLTTTNFITQVRTPVVGTAYELSDFPRRYLQKTLTIDRSERDRLQNERSNMLTLGGGIRAAHERNPYLPDTIDVRGIGDYSAARILREALELASRGQVEEGFSRCAEAAELAPGYHEAHRVEAYLHTLSSNLAEADNAYEQARDFAPDSAHVAYFFGKFLVDSGYDRLRGVRELQRAATLDPQSAIVQMEVVAAHIEVGDFQSAMEAAAFAGSSTVARDQAAAAYFLLWRACAYASEAATKLGAWSDLAEAIEQALALEGADDPERLDGLALDLLLWVSEMAATGANDSAEQYVASRLAKHAHHLGDVARLNATGSLRRIGEVRKLVDKGYGFVYSGGIEYFFHASAFGRGGEFDRLVQGSTLAFTPAAHQGKMQASAVHWIG